jgi:hypothetical protein
MIQNIYKFKLTPKNVDLFFVSDANFVSHITQEYKLMEVRYNGADRDICAQEEGGKNRMENTA